MTDTNWHIIGGDDLAGALRNATTYVKVDRSATIVTVAETVPDGAIATGRAVLVQNARQILPHLTALRVVDEVVRAVHAGDVGQVFGCYGSYRVERGSEPDAVAHDALLPLLAVTLEILNEEVTDVWARRASLLAEGDAWFVTIHMGAVILTLEAMATTDPLPAGSDELLIEVTGSEQVLRAEPFKQAVTVAPFDSPAHAHRWLEDTGERLLQRVLELDTRPVLSPADRLRTVWAAVQESAESGEPISLA